MGGCRACAGPCRDERHVVVPGYEVEAVLGRGGFGVVVRGRAGGRAVAIKLAHDGAEARARLDREREVLATIGPPLVPALLGHGTTDDGAAFIVMELIDGPTLRAQIAGGREAEGWMRPLIAAIAALHARGVVHRDLKPDNVLVRDGRAVLIDFGLARRGEGEAGALTAPGLAAGTAIYAAPEQLAGQAVTAAADVYALGVVLYELATGQPPFVGSDAELRVAHHARRPRPPRELAAISEELEAVILDCMVKDPARRPSAGEVLARFDRIADLRGTATVAATAPSRRARTACGVVMFEATRGASVAAIAELVAGERGELAGVVEGEWAAVFAAGDGGRPLERASRAAEALVARGHAARAVVELCELIVRTRADGTRHVVSDVHGAMCGRLARVAAGAVGDGEGGERPTAALAATALREPAFVGRAALIATLIEASGAGGAVTVIASADGAGRTRLARHLVEQLRARGADVVAISLRDADAGGPHAGLRVIAHALGADAVDAAVEEDAAALAHALGRPVDDAWIARLQAAPGAYRGAVARGLAAAIVRVARRGPRVVVIDDAELAELATLDALRIAADAAGAQLAICLVSRRSLWDGQAALVMPPLDDAAAVAACHELLQPALDVPAAAIARLVELAGGNPRRLVELCRSLHAMGAIRPRARGGDHYLDASVLDATLAQVARGERHELVALDPALRDAAAALALLAPGWAAGDAIAILERLPCDDVALDPRAALERLRRRGLIDGDAVLRFASAALGEALASSLAPERARRVHAAAVAHYRAALAGDRRAALTRLAPHLAALGDGEPAAAMFVELAGLARDEHDDLAAEGWYGRALELITQDRALELVARRGRAAMRHRLGRYEDSIGDTERGGELARAAGDRALEAELWLDQATALDWIGELARSAARLDRARALLGDAPAPRLHVRLLVATGRRAWRTGIDPTAAVAPLERALAIAAALGDEVYEDRVSAMVMLVFLLPQLDRLDDAERLAAETVALCVARGDRHHLMATLSNRQVVSMRRGLVGRAIADLEHAARIGRELGVPLVRYTTELSLAGIHRRTGDLARARHHAAQARRAETEGSAAGSRQTAAIMLLPILVAQGELAAARALLGELRADGLHEEEALLVRAVTLGLAERDDAAAWDGLLAALARAPGLVPDVLEQRGLAARRRGDVIGARQHLGAAAAAAALHDPASVARLERAREAPA